MRFYRRLPPGIRGPSRRSIFARCDSWWWHFQVRARRSREPFSAKHRRGRQRGSRNRRSEGREPPPARLALQREEKDDATMSSRHSFEKLLRELNSRGHRQTNIIGNAPKPPSAGLGGIGFGERQMDGGTAGGIQIAEWGGCIGIESESGLAADFAERVFRLFGIQLGGGDEGVAVKDRSVQNLDGRLNEIASDGKGNFATSARAHGLQIFAACGAVMIEQIKGDLGVKDRLADALERKELRGLRFELFDARTAGFGNRAEENERETRQTHAAEGIEEFRGGDTGSGRNSVQSFAFVGVVAHAFDGEPHVGALDAERGAGQVDDGGAGFAGGGKITLRKGFRAGEE